MYVPEHDVRLAPHLGRLQRHDVENRPVGGKEHVQGRAEIVLLYLGRWEVPDVQPRVVAPSVTSGAPSSPAEAYVWFAGNTGTLEGNPAPGGGSTREAPEAAIANPTAIQ